MVGASSAMGKGLVRGVGPGLEVSLDTSHLGRKRLAGWLNGCGGVVAFVGNSH